MGKKYIIELPENTHWIQWIIESTKDHHPYMDFKQVEDLTPYTEPDIEQVRKEAYQKGYETGYKDGYNEPGKGKIQVGDEVIYNGTTTCVVFSPENDKRYASIIDADGVHYSADHRELTKTGRHFPEIAEVLAKMKES